MDIYHMKLHERLASEDGLLEIIRVPGGWIYRHWNPITNWDFAAERYDTRYDIDSVFVPLNHEFQETQDE